MVVPQYGKNVVSKLRSFLLKALLKNVCSNAFFFFFQWVLRYGKQRKKNSCVACQADVDLIMFVTRLFFDFIFAWLFFVLLFFIVRLYED
jgi:hypothetical protein